MLGQRRAHDRAGMEGAAKKNSRQNFEIHPRARATLIECRFISFCWLFCLSLFASRQKAWKSKVRKTTKRTRYSHQVFGFCVSFLHVKFLAIIRSLIKHSTFHSPLFSRAHNLLCLLISLFSLSPTTVTNWPAIRRRAPTSARVSEWKRTRRDLTHNVSRKAKLLKELKARNESNERRISSLRRAQRMTWSANYLKSARLGSARQCFDDFRELIKSYQERFYYFSFSFKAKPNGAKEVLNSRERDLFIGYVN
jgi:hypothetical protein